MRGAILPMRIILPLVLVIGYEQILICHILMPLKKDKAVLMNSVLGASVGIIFNILLVSHWGSGVINCLVIIRNYST